MVASDAQAMKLALRLARRGEGQTSPNPMVGAVVTWRGEVVGTGWHRAAGTPHAETIALDEAGPRARGATLYVTLEPCVHHARTPPCVDCLLTAGVARVVVATVDPDPRVSGRGISALEAAGVDAEVGMLETEARSLNAAYFVHRLLGRPFVTYKAAVSLDGRIAASDGSSRWITGPEARRDVHRLRARSDAICVGIGTMLADDPSLTVRGVRRHRPPRRIVVDSAARTPPGARILSGEAPTMVVTTQAAPEARVRDLESAGAEVIRVGSRGGMVSVPDMLERLAGRGVVSMLLEGGATLAGAFAESGLIDRYVWYVAPKLIGGPHSTPALQGWAAPTIEQAWGLHFESVRRIGQDVRIVASPVAGPAE